MNVLDSLHQMDEQLNRYHLSCEAIHFQANSAFPIELEKIYEGVFDVARKFDEEHPPMVGDTKQIYDKHTALYNFIVKEAGPKIIKIIEKHTNFKVAELVSGIPSDYDSGLNLFMGIMGSNDANDVISAINKAEGLHSSISSSKMVDKVREMSDSLNRARGTIDKSVDIVTILGVPVGMFVIDDFIFDKSNRQIQLTAKEIAALTLHEVGHIMTFIEHVGDLGFIGYFGNNVLNDLDAVVKKDPKQSALDFADLAEKAVKDAVSKMDKVVFYNAATLLRKAAAKESVEPDYSQAGYHLDKNSVIILTLIMFVIQLKNAIRYAAIISAPQSNSQYDRFSSREYVTKRQASMFERVADEYVSRYGLAKDLFSAFEKFEIIDKHIAKSSVGMPIYNKIIRENTLVKTTLAITNLPNRMLRYLIEVRCNGFYATYESDFTRLKRHISNNYDILKNKTLSKEVRNQILNDIEYMENALLNLKPSPITAITKSIISKIVNLPSAALQSPTYLFGSAKLDAEYFEFFEGVDDLLSNKAAYYAGKMDNLFKNRG